ncbi:tRNA (adenine-N6-)-methyltransferase [Aureococcus anophagefferens]|nr:tRNA (adenine-N6-)-methyltransferase [Aureococcus anophagefferens]
MSRVLLLLAAAYARDDDDDAAWIERWRRGGASRCTRTHCGWLADAGPIDVGCEFEISQTGLAKRGASSKAPELAVRPGGGPARSFAPHALDEALDVPSLCAYREPGTIRGEDRTRQRGVVALVAASSLPYLFTQWAPLVNKMAYFRVMGLDWSLWLGDLDPRIAETTSKACEARLAAQRSDNATALSWWSLDRDSFWRTKSMKFYVRAGDAVAFEILGRWVESRCGFKDQLPLWHALLGVADARRCLRVPYDGALYASFDYREALTYPARTRAADRPAPAEDAYLTTCADIAAKCPDLRICDSTARLLHGFYHQSVESTNTRSFAYATRKGKAKVLEVANSLRDFRDLKGCRSVYECPD